MIAIVKFLRPDGIEAAVIVDGVDNMDDGKIWSSFIDAFENPQPVIITGIDLYDHNRSVYAPHTLGVIS